MILASHIIVSGILGSQTGNYFLAAALGLASHYALDAIPHWDYYISPGFDSKAEKEGWHFLAGKFFLKELIKISADILIGLVLVFIFLKNLNEINLISAFVGIFFGVLPDPLQLLYHISHWKFLKLNYEFQLAIQKTKSSLGIGIFTQIAIVILVFLALRLWRMPL